MLVEGAIGDAYGAGFEYASEMNKFNDLSHYVFHPRHKLPLGTYTDDTQMAIALAELIASGKEWTPLNIANSFVDCFKRDWRDGYARGFQKFLESIESGQEFLDQIRPQSDKSGAAMRAAPVGVFKTIAEVLEKSTIQSKLTHDTPDGIAAGQASALITHYFLYDVDVPIKLGKWLDKQVKCPHGKWDEDWVGKVKSKGWMSVKAAVTAVKRNNSLDKMLIECIDFTGDTDTVATIAMSAASCSHDYSKRLPDRLWNELENNKYGRDYLIDLDKKLLGAI